MQHLRTDDIIKATGGQILSGRAREFTGLSIDSRTVGEGELFVALQGDNFDGHDFIHDALKKAGGAIVHHRPALISGEKTVISVANTLVALQDIAHYFRLGAGIPVIGITGTNGKTTTKEFIASILGKSRKVLKTTGNLNNHIGLPLCISRMKGDEDVMVLEMGSNAEGDIKLLCDIASPDYAVITNVGPAHLEGFGNLETVRKTDLEILDYVETAVVNADDLFLLEGTRAFNGTLITYGLGDKADVRARDILQEMRRTSFTLCLPGGMDMRIDLGLAGKFNVYNALAAAALAHRYGAGPLEIKEGLESFTGVPMRLEVREILGALIINDVYNANPASMEEALKELARLKKERAIAVLGDMLELGVYSGEAHRRLVKQAADSGVDIIISVGKETGDASRTFTGSCFRTESAEEARTVLLGILEEGDTVLIKGSRGMRMERVLDAGGTPSSGGERHAV
jgi:UDP-N-acetylmuramoyl-tripeptide--D-alanyl-D-alanine ligase